MELRKDPITQSWVILGQREARGEAQEECPLEPAKNEKLRTIMNGPSGEEWPHAHSQVTATIFVPRRIKYELSSAHEWFKDKERCIFCDTVRQEEKQGKRIVDVQGEYYALCPYASRVPYEVWLMHRRHNHLFEQPRPGSNRRQLGALLGRVLRRPAR